MKSFLNQIIVSFLAILIVASFTQAIEYSGLDTLIIAASILSILNVFLKPFLKLILVPINVITLGLLGWLVNVIILYLVTLLVSGFDIVSFSVTIGSLTLSFSTFIAYIVTAFMINLISRGVSWIISS